MKTLVSEKQSFSDHVIQSGRRLHVCVVTNSPRQATSQLAEDIVKGSSIETHSDMNSQVIRRYTSQKGKTGRPTGDPF